MMKYVNYKISIKLVNFKGVTMNNVNNNNQNVNWNPPEQPAVQPKTETKAERQPTFKSQNTYETRKEVARRIREQYPDSYPVIVELDPRAQMILEITKKKFLAPGEIPLNKFMLEVRKVIKMGKQDPLAMMVESGQMVSANARMSDLWNRFKDPDGFLYILFSGDV